MHFQQAKCTYGRNITNTFKGMDLQIWAISDPITYKIRPCPPPQIFYHGFPLLTPLKDNCPKRQEILPQEQSPRIQNRAGEGYGLAQMEKQTDCSSLLLASWREQCCTHTKYGIAFFTSNVSSSTTIRRFTQGLICNHAILFNNVPGLETYWVKWLMQDSAMVQLENNIYKAGALEHSDPGTNI